MNQPLNNKGSLSETMVLWQRATPIKVARLEIADGHLVEQLKQLSKVSFSSEFTKSGIRAGITNKDLMPILKAVTDRSFEAASRRDAINREVDQNFIKMVQSGKFRCFAFEHPRHISSTPVEMLREHWTHYPQWDTGEFKANGLHLIELRVLPSELAVFDASFQETAPQGRPSFKPEIIAAYLALKKDGALPDRPMTKWFPAINIWIKTHRPHSNAAKSENGVGNQSIRNALKDIIAAK